MTTPMPWDDPHAPEHVRKRQPVCELAGSPGIRHDLPRRRPAIEWPRALQGVSYGVTVMTHRGSSNGRLSVCLSSIPENFDVMVASDSVAHSDVIMDEKVAHHHGAGFSHLQHWGGRAANALHAMSVATWDYVLYLCDDVWLYPETTLDALRWTRMIENTGVPLATLAIPLRHTRDEHRDYGMDSWQQCLDEPWQFEALGPVDGWQRAPCLYRNPFGACMVIVRKAYEDLGGFAKEYWAHDDVWNHRVWTSGRWVNAAMPGRGFIHFGGQSWHHGETEEYVGSFKAATGMLAEESGNRQAEAQFAAAEKWGEKFLALGGTSSI